MKIWKNLMFASLFVGSVLSMSSCEKEDEDDDSGSSSCSASLIDQDAQGMFQGTSFSVVDGFAKEDPFESTEYRCTLYGETVTGDICDDWNFNRPTNSIIFSIPKATGTYNLGFGDGKYTVTFNKAETNNTTATVAVCGKIVIETVSSSSITGKIVADAQDNESELNGNFTIDLCN